MKQSDFEKIKQKSATKKNGTYSHNGIFYKVKDGFPIGFIDGNDVLQCSYGFLINIGKTPARVDKKKYINEVFA